MNPAMTTVDRRAPLPSAMSGEALRAARVQLGLDIEEFADWLGLMGANAGEHVLRLERGRKPISGTTRMLVLAYLDGYRPTFDGEGKVKAANDDRVLAFEERERERLAKEITERVGTLLGSGYAVGSHEIEDVVLDVLSSKPEQAA